MIAIAQKITGWQVGEAPPDAAAPAEPQPAAPDQMHEGILRPEHLSGSTYRIRTPLSEHALYVTINDVVLNPGTEHEQRRPFDIFINSKNMDHFQWIIALTRIISAVFRKGGEVSFLAEELQSVFDPRGGYFKRGGKYMPSLVAEIGSIIEHHLRSIGMIQDQAPDHTPDPTPSAAATLTDGFPPGATHCERCYLRAVVPKDGCPTCLNCGHSKCG
jgi:hypothetical protein